MKEIDCGLLVNAAVRFAQMIDAGNAMELWERASSAGREILDAETFHNTIVASGRPLQAPVSRHWSQVTRHTQGNDAELPAGTYVAVEFSTCFAGGKACDERVTLRRDEDDSWRLIGYAMR